MPLCAECMRNRDEEADFAMMDLQDGDLDGIIDRVSQAEVLG